MFLQREPSQAEALIIRARCHAKLGRSKSAVSDFNSAITRCSTPDPSLFLERAKLQATLGKFDEAVRGLDEAITNSTSFAPLQLAAIEYDRLRGAFDSALARVDRFVTRYPVKEPWLTLRAEVLEQAGRTPEAAQTFQQVLSGIETYPAIRRSLDLTKQLENRASQGLARTQAKPNTNPPVKS
jgi:tetratricopeptide (TPR) repeat protein